MWGQSVHLQGVLAECQEAPHEDCATLGQALYFRLSVSRSPCGGAGGRNGVGLLQPTPPAFLMGGGGGVGGLLLQPTSPCLPPLHSILCFLSIQLTR